MSGVGNKAILNAYQVARVMKINQSIVGHGTIVTFETFMCDIFHTIKIFAESDGLHQFRLKLTPTSPRRLEN